MAAGHEVKHQADRSKAGEGVMGLYQQDKEPSYPWVYTAKKELYCSTSSAWTATVEFLHNIVDV